MFFPAGLTALQLHNFSGPSRPMGIGLTNRCLLSNPPSRSASRIRLLFPYFGKVLKLSEDSPTSESTLTLKTLAGATAPDNILLKIPGIQTTHSKISRQQFIGARLMYIFHFHFFLLKIILILHFHLLVENEKYK